MLRVLRIELHLGKKQRRHEIRADMRRGMPAAPPWWRGSILTVAMFFRAGIDGVSEQGTSRRD
jgi:hypothetical protein